MSEEGDSVRKGAVILLHGFAGFPGIMQPFAVALRKSGYRTVTPWYDSWRLPLREIVDRLIPNISAFASKSHSEDPIHFVGHSMGGLIARALIARQRPTRLGRVVMLGTPNSGSEIADLLHRRPVTRAVLGKAAPALITVRDAELESALGRVDYPLGVIAGSQPILPVLSDRILPTPHDGKVAVASTHVAGEIDHLILPLSHTMLAYHPTAHHQTEAFLASGAFIRDEFIRSEGH